MKIYDITQEVFGCVVYPGDPEPKREILNDMGKGDLYNLTKFSMCAHNGTHVDAPRHFIEDGKTIDEMGLHPFVGPVYVAFHEGVVTATDAKDFLQRAQKEADRMAETTGWDEGKRMLIKGNAEVSFEAAEVFADAGLLLLGNESQTVGPESGPMAVHVKLLGVGMALLEGVRLFEVPEGMYLLNAAPLNLGGAEGAPCRAILMDFQK